MNPHHRARIACLALLLSAASVPSSAQWMLERSVVGNGGGTLTGDSFILDVTCGQAAIGLVSSVDLSAEIGFWHAAGAGTSDLPEAAEERPLCFELRPGPSRRSPGGSIRFSVPHTALIRVSIYDVRGRLLDVLVDGEIAAGHHEALLPSSHWPSGIYFCRLSAEGAVLTTKLIHMR